MSSELEGTTEAHKTLQESLSERVEELKEEISHQHDQDQKDRHWLNQVSLSTAVLAVLASIAAMVGNSLDNDGMLHQLKANDYWSYYQAKATKRHVHLASVSLLQALEKPVPPLINEEITRLSQEQKVIRKQALKLEKKAKNDFQRHEFFAYSVAALQIGISLSAMAALLRQRLVWYLSMVLAAIGVILMACGAVM